MLQPCPTGSGSGPLPVKKAFFSHQLLMIDTTQSIKLKASKATHATKIWCSLPTSLDVLFSFCHLMYVDLSWPTPLLLSLSNFHTSYSWTEGIENDSCNKNMMELTHVPGRPCYLSFFCHLFFVRWFVFFVCNMFPDFI